TALAPVLVDCQRLGDSAATHLVHTRARPQAKHVPYTTLFRSLGRALGEPDEGVALPTRYVFDEGHHVFAAADSAFAGHLSGQERSEEHTSELQSRENRVYRLQLEKQEIELTARPVQFFVIDRQ